MTGARGAVRAGAAAIAACACLMAPHPIGVAVADTGSSGPRADRGETSRPTVQSPARRPLRAPAGQSRRASAHPAAAAPRHSDPAGPRLTSPRRQSPVTPTDDGIVAILDVSRPGSAAAAGGSVGGLPATRAVAPSAPARVMSPWLSAPAHAAVAIRLDRWFESALGRLGALPNNALTNLLSGALWLARRTLVPPLMVASGTGVNLSTELADPAPSYQAAVAAIKQQGITSVRMYDIVPAALNQIQAQIPGAKVAVAVPNSMVARLASDPSYAATLVAQLKPYGSMVTAVNVGNEVDTGPFALATVTQAVQNMQAAIAAEKLPIATAVSFTMNFIANSYPPSNSVLNPNLAGLTTLLQQLKDFVEVDIYPLMDIQGDPADITLDYALGNPDSSPVNDNGVTYHSLFWAEYDAARWALNKAGITIPLQVGETGWATSSVGSQSIYSTVTNAQTYNQNVVDSMATTGSPKFKITNVPFYLFELIDENQKTGGIFEPYWGWYSVSGSPGSLTLSPKYMLSLKSTQRPVTGTIN